MVDLAEKGEETRKEIWQWTIRIQMEATDAEIKYHVRIFE